MTRAALASATRLSANIIHAYERDQKKPSESTIKALCETLGFPPEFFSAGEIDEFPADGVSFRALTSLTAAQRNKALAAGELAETLSHWITERFRSPDSNVPNMRGFAPEDAAEALRTEWGLGQRPINNMVHLIEAHGVKVFSLPDDCCSVDAFSVWRSNVPFVFLTTTKSGERGRMDAAHELGHLVLHGHGGPAGREAELEADRFGSAFLMPRGSVLGAVPRAITLSVLINLKHNWGVSLAALVHRLKTLGLVSEWHYRTLCIELAKNGYRKSEPQGMPRETSQLLNKVFTALREDSIPRASVARQLNIPIAEMESLVFGLVMTSVQGGRHASGPRASSTRPQLQIVKE